MHPPGVLDRHSGEHWAGRWYMRAVSVRWTRHLVSTRVTPNQLTALMVVSGVVAGAALLVPGPAGALAAALLVQLYLLLDCVDGEVARWRGTTSVTGIYLDRVGHYLAEAALLVGFGLRAANAHPQSGPPVGGAASDWGWAFLGTLAALGAILIKAETDLVDVARVRGGAPVAPRGATGGAATGGPVEKARATPRSAGLARARRVMAALRIHRLVNAVEASLLVLLLAALDATYGGLFFTRLGVAVVACVALAQIVLHLVSVLSSSRLR